MPNIADLTEESRFIGMFVGPSGSGKTCAEGSFPKPIEFWDFDGRIRGLLGASWIDRNEGMSYEYFLPREPNLIDRLEKKLELMHMASNNPAAGLVLPRTLVLDSLTSQTLAIVQQSIGITHSRAAGEAKKGKYLGNVAMVGPEDYGIEANVTYSMFAYFRSLKIQNIIVSAHVVDKWGKEPGADPYADRVVVGEQLSVRPKIAENVGIYFDHCFRLEKKEEFGNEKFYVKFRGAPPYKTAYKNLPGGEVDITGKNFYETMMGFVRQGSTPPA